jgi:hypothetical protein
MLPSHLDYFQVKSPLGSRPDTKRGDHGTPQSHNHWFIVSNHVWGPYMDIKFTVIALNWRPNHLWLHTTLESQWSHYMILEVSWDDLWILLLGSHNFMVTALGSRVWSGLRIYNHGMPQPSADPNLLQVSLKLGWGSPLLYASGPHERTHTA